MATPNPPERIRLTQATCKLLEAALGEGTAHDWMWEHTPYPAALPSDEQVVEALEWVAAGKEEGLRLMGLARRKVDEDMRQAMAEIKASQTAEVASPVQAARMALTETVTVTRPIDSRIADLVYFAKALAKRHSLDLKGLTDEQLIEAANDFWESQHGEE